MFKMFKSFKIFKMFKMFTIKEKQGQNVLLHIE